MKQDNLDYYEELSVGSGDAPIPDSFMSKKKFKKPINKRKISFILLLIIIGLAIFFIIKTAFVSSLSEQNNELQNEINSLSKKEEKLKSTINKINDKKEFLIIDNNNLNQKINEIKEKNKEINENNNIMIKEIREKDKTIKNYEDKINDSKNKLTNLIYKENNIREKINSCNNQIKSLQLKIEELSKNLKDKNLNMNNIDYKEIKEQKKVEKRINKYIENNLNEINPNVKSRINSKIIVDPNHLNLLDKWFKKELKYKLLYRASEDGYSPKIFHNKVDNFKNNLILIKDVNNFIYGGFTRKTWEGNKVYKNDKNAIVFNLDKEKYYKIKNENYAIFCDPDNLAIFGEQDIYIGAKGIKSIFPKNYGSVSENKENELVLGYKKLNPLEIEVFQLN